MREYINSEDRQDNVGVDVKYVLFTLLQYWYLFILSIVICMGAAWLHLRYEMPVYQVVSSIIIMNDKGGPSEDVDLRSLGIQSTATNNFDNELLVLRSRSLLKTVVTELDLYITYMIEGRVREVELYNSAPIKVWISPEEAAILNGGTVLTFNRLDDGKISVATIINGEEQMKIFDKLPAQLTTPSVTFNLDARDEYSIEGWNPERAIYVSVASPIEVAGAYKEQLTIRPVSTSTTVANLTLNTTDRQRGVDFLNKLVEVYNREANEAKNEVARKTADFINDRILIINGELGLTERELEDYKRNAGIVNNESDAQLAITENTEYKRLSAENSTQLRLVQFLNEYTSDDENKYEVLPANIGLIDPGLSSLIESYNELLFERSRLLLTSSLSNPAVVNLDVTIGSARANIRTTIESAESALLIKQKDIEAQALKSSSRISNAPTRERELVGIMRQQEIQSGLYLMLLQKREENAMALATTANNARIFEETFSIGTPISPDKRMIYMIALLFGLIIPAFLVFILELFKFKIQGRQDVEKLTQVPVVGDIPFTKRKFAKDSIVVRENTNDMMAEAFRDLRTNMMYMLGVGEKVIMVTSTTSGEGKSFISVNLAISLALMGKKVIIVGLDIRKPGLNQALNISNKEDGISRYLANPTIDLKSLISPSMVAPNLDILLGGAIPPNPTELLARESLPHAINMLREEYDYVVLDTAPIGMVTDTQIISKVADAAIYVCRVNYTHKGDYQSSLNMLKAQNKLPNVSTVINGVDTSKRKYGYYNKYGYAYSGKYGYGYEDNKSKK